MWTTRSCVSFFKLIPASKGRQADIIEPAAIGTASHTLTHTRPFVQVQLDKAEAAPSVDEHL